MLSEQAFEIVDLAVEKHAVGREIVAKAILFSGGNDSTVMAHLFRGYATHAIHANTGIGIEKTRQFVRDTCAEWHLPLIEVHGESYRDLVLDKGFPGPAMHWKMYQRLKERALDKARHELEVANKRKICALYLAGRRREESRRREDIVLHERDGSVIWASPMANWTKLDLNTYRLMHDVPLNDVTQNIHMSGECLCGAFAKPGELDEIAYFYPEVAAEIRALQDEVRAAGHPEEICVWGHGQGRKKSRSGKLCSSCDFRAGEGHAAH
jgi:3'-phosphoadenosine 5'-phosphosulfate sulfotransferase (PAPS reductase)/FAD synthetase